MSYKTRIFAMGGIEEVGKNMYVVEHQNDILVIDAGIKFANESLLGMSGLIPDYSYLKNTTKNIYLLITHGHEDHIGGVPYLLSEIKEIKKVYAPILSMELIKKKLNEFKIKIPEGDDVVINENSEIKTKDFKIEIFRVCHSIPDSFGVFIETPNGNIVSTGDFRFDFCGDEQTDIKRISEISRRDITLLLCETTNSETPGFSDTEVNIIENIHKVLKNAPGRVFISTFSSNLSRIEKIIENAISINKKICIIGRSMENNINIARRIGFLHVSDSDFVSTKEIDSLKDNELLFILTGSQGEERAALNQIALGIHPKIITKPTDTYILSSNPIPGNFQAVEELVNKLYKTGAKVLQHKLDGIFHASGHATVQEQQLMIKLVDPKYIIPIHGEYKMLKAMRNNAEKAEFHRESVVIIKNGEVAILENQEVYKSDEVIDVGPLLIDGRRISNNSIETIKQREELSSEGIFNVILNIDRDQKKLKCNPQIATRGIFFVKDTISLIQKISYSIKDEVEKKLKENAKVSENELRKIIQETSKFYIWKNKKKNPIIISTIFE